MIARDTETREPKGRAKKEHYKQTQKLRSTAVWGHYNGKESPTSTEPKSIITLHFFLSSLIHSFIHLFIHLFNKCYVY